MSKPNYRVILTFDGDRKVFAARAPELEHCTAEGATRAEAMTRLEEEIDAQLANMLSHGATPPRAVDEEVVTGELAIKISKPLHRELLYQARSEGIELDHLVSELIAAAHESRKGAHRTNRSGNRQPQEHVPHDSIGNRDDGRQRGGGRNFGGGGGGQRGGYGTQLLDNQPNFMEYVRGLEHQGSRPGGDRGGPGGPGGGGGRRRRGRGGQGGGGGGGGRPYDQQRGNQFSRNGGAPSGAGNQQPQSPMSSAPQSGPPPSSGGGEGGENT